MVFSGMTISHRPVCVKSAAPLLVALAAAACWAQPVPSRPPHPSFARIEDNPALPRVLLLGDSISMSYTLPVRELLRGKANVHRPPDNCRSTRYTLERMEEFLGRGRWDVIHFNWGIHDATYLDPQGKAAEPPVGSLQVPLREYERNLGRLLDRLKKTGAALIWCTTTPVGPAARFRRAADMVEYNRAARNIIAAEGLKVDDLHTLASRLSDGLSPDGVHFTPAGAARLARQVAASIEAGLAQRLAAASPANRMDAFARRLLGVSGEHWALLEKARAAGLVEVAPVHLPVGAPGANNHYGWPIATMAGKALVLMHRRIPGHNPLLSGYADADSTYMLVMRSTDGGRTWSQPYDLRDAMAPADRTRGGVLPLAARAKFDPENRTGLGYRIHLHAIGVARDGAVLAIGNYGAFRSEDQGRTWKHSPLAFREDQDAFLDGAVFNVGPRILDHPEHGLLVFGNRHKLSGKADDHLLLVYRSADGGRRWQRWAAAELPEWCLQYEPSALLRGKDALLVTRDQKEVRAHFQMKFRPGAPVEVQRTNLIDRRYVDTVDLDFNPRTGRLEVVRSDRDRMRVELWSIDPARWDSGEWRKEATLLAREGEFYVTGDGFHPAGAVIDAQRGVQHIFIYSGFPGGPAGVFRITRTLDTARLGRLLQP